MTTVAIVARTRVNDTDLCIGALDLETFECLRLSTSDGLGFNHDAPFAVGTCWLMNYVPKSQSHIESPHVEDVNVRSFSATSMEIDLARVIVENQARLPVWTGSPSSIFDGVLRGLPLHEQGRYSGGLFLFRDSLDDDSTRSLGFWIPDRQLRVTTQQRRNKGPRQLVNYVVADGSTPTYAIGHSGLSILPAIIAAGSVLSVSLARWWSPSDIPGAESRCTLQVCDLL